MTWLGDVPPVGASVGDRPRLRHPVLTLLCFLVTNLSPSWLDHGPLTLRQYAKEVDSSFHRCARSSAFTLTCERLPQHTNVVESIGMVHGTTERA